MMKRFDKGQRAQDRWKDLVESSYEFGYLEGDYLFAAGYQAALPKRGRRKLENPDHVTTAFSPEQAAAIP